MDFNEYFPQYYTPAGQPTDLDGVVAETMRRGGPTVAQTMVIDAADPARNVAVSTTYTGLGRRAPGRPPLIFTSHALLNDGTGLSEVSENHYPSELLARKGHTQMVAEIADTMIDPVVTDVPPPRPPDSGI